MPTLPVSPGKNYPAPFLSGNVDEGFLSKQNSFSLESSDSPLPSARGCVQKTKIRDLAALAGRQHDPAAFPADAPGHDPALVVDQSPPKRALGLGRKDD